MYAKYGASLVAKTVKSRPKTQVQSLDGEESLEKEMILQYSCLEGSMDKKAWQATIHGVTKSQEQLSN